MSMSPVIVALDVASYDDAMRLAAQLNPKICRLKIGKGLFTRCGEHVVQGVHDLGYDVFLDLKYHDIPNTVADAVSAAADLGVWMVNVHASGGEMMLQQAVAAVNSTKVRKPLLIAVTVLTSFSAATLSSIGVRRGLTEQVAYLTALAAQSGCDGVVCSAHEAAAVKQAHGHGFITVTPGIRPEWAAIDDQHRIMMPQQAVDAGSDYLVIGRPINRADNPKDALERIVNSLEGVL